MALRHGALLWLQAVEEDLRDAVDMLERGRWFRVAFFARKAAEKALKTLFFIVCGEEPQGSTSHRTLLHAA